MYSQKKKKCRGTSLVLKIQVSAVHHSIGITIAAISNFVSFSNLKLQIGWWQHLGGINLVGLANTCCNSPVQVDNLSSFIFNGQKKGQFFFF